jgi:3-oxoacyl-[acyl-carrier-protein] synthase-3
MSLSRIDGVRVTGVATCVPPRIADNLDHASAYGDTEVRKVVAMAGVRQRRVVEPGVTSVDLCHAAASRLLADLGWAAESITGLILVTQTPDYFLPSSSCVIHSRLGLSDNCAAFDVGLGCSGYPYGLYLASTMLRAGGHQRILMLHGETPSLFTSPEDHATTLLFGDAGSATALEADPSSPGSYFALHTDGSGADQLIIRGGAFRDRQPSDPRDLCVRMDGGGIFNFTVKRVPALIKETLEFAGRRVDEVSGFMFHQSNRFIMQHIAKKCGLPDDRVPLPLERFGNCGGPSVAVALTQAPQAVARGLVMLLGYGVGLSWGAALLSIDERAPLIHFDYAGNATHA